MKNVEKVEKAASIPIDEYLRLVKENTALKEKIAKIEILVESLTRRKAL